MEWAKTLAGQGDAIGKLVEKGEKPVCRAGACGQDPGRRGPGRHRREGRQYGHRIWAWTVLGVRPVHLCAGCLEPLAAACATASDLADLHRPVRLYHAAHSRRRLRQKALMNASLIAQMKHGVRILNFARGELVNTAAMVNALKTGQRGLLCVRFSQRGAVFRGRRGRASRTWAPPHRRARTTAP